MDSTTRLTVPRVTRREWAWAGAFAAVVMALTTVPYLVAAASQNPEWRFGGFLLAVVDGNSYIAKMGEGARGAWLFTLPYSTEPQRGVLVYSFYLLLGRLAGRVEVERAVEIIASGAEPLRELIGAMHSKMLVSALRAQRGER